MFLQSAGSHEAGGKRYKFDCRYGCLCGVSTVKCNWKCAMLAHVLHCAGLELCWIMITVEEGSSYIIRCMTWTCLHMRSLAIWELPWAKCMMSLHSDHHFSVLLLHNVTMADQLSRNFRYLQVQQLSGYSYRTTELRQGWAAHQQGKLVLRTILRWFDCEFKRIICHAYMLAFPSEHDASTEISPVLAIVLQTCVSFRSSAIGAIVSMEFYLISCTTVMVISTGN